MKIRFTIFFLSIGMAMVFGQEFKFSQIKVPIEKGGQMTLRSVVEDWSPSLQNLDIHRPKNQMTDEELRELKKRFHERKSSNSRSFNDTALVPAIGKNFGGNPYNQRVPNDNDMAISNDGILVSVINSTIFIYDTEADTMMQLVSLAAFAQSLGYEQSKYDPRVCYDPIHDRFIVLFLNGTTYQTSQVIVGFSQTNDPTGDWNLYALPGNPLNNDTWSDYPYIAVSTKDLYISINTFYNGSSNNSGYVESTFWQVALDDGYSGQTLTTAYYSNLSFANKNLFNTTAVKGGSEPYGPDMFLLSNRNLDTINDTVFLFHVTDHVKGNPNLEMHVLVSDLPYGLPPEARQAGVHRFDTNDSRVLGAFKQNNKIQYVANCFDPNTGFCAIYHGTISDPYVNREMTAVLIGDSVLDLGYSNISYAGKNEYSDAALINSNYSSPTDYSGCLALMFDGSAYSPLVRLAEGTGTVNVLAGGYERWGDYSGSQLRYNQPGVVWMSGSYGRSGFGQGPGTWIGEFISPLADTIPSSEIPDSPIFFPNPFIDLFSVEFFVETATVLRFELYDNLGKRVATLMEENAKVGKNVFSFNVLNLAVGTYYLRISYTDGREFHTAKVIKN